MIQHLHNYKLPPSCGTCFSPSSTFMDIVISHKEETLCIPNLVVCLQWNTLYTIYMQCFDERLTVHRRWHEESKTNSMLHNGLLELMNRSTCFGHYYAHRQELATVQMASAYGSSPWLWQVAGLVHGCRFWSVQLEGCFMTRRGICIVASSWWWA